VAGNHITRVIDQDRVQPAELDDRRRDLRHLVLAVRAGIARIRHQSVERPMLDRIGQPGRHLVQSSGVVTWVVTSGVTTSLSTWWAAKTRAISRTHRTLRPGKAGNR
jgi:hypothetical protein